MLAIKQNLDLTSLFKEFKDIFSWNLSDIPHISTNIISLELKIDPMIKQLTQNRRTLGEDMRLVVSQIGSMKTTIYKFSQGCSHPYMDGQSHPNEKYNEK